MRLFVVLAGVLVTACASAGTPLALREHAAPPALVLTSDPVAERSFPERVSTARLPTADRARLAGTYSAAVKLCVAPDGTVDSIAVEHPSASPAFDRALAADLPAWRYEPYVAPAGIRVCEQVTVSYLSD